MNVKTLNFVSLTSLFDGYDGLMAEFCDICTASFGDASHTMITKLRAKEEIDGFEFEHDGTETIIERIMSLPDGTYIDLET